MATIPESAKVVAANVREQLRARGMTQQELADLLGLPQPRVAELLKPKKDPKIGTLERVAAALKLPLAALVTPAQESFPTVE